VSVPFRARDAATWSGGELVRGDAEAELRGVSIDTRTLAPGVLFVAIPGPRHDGHDHLAAALGAGARGLAVARGRALPEIPDPRLPVVAVDDTTAALGRIALGHRRGFDGPLVAITGSNGKTTTKEMCAAILSLGGPTLRNRGNLNNQYGLPLTLLEREAYHRRVVVELGMNHRGEIAALTELALPDVGVVTNVGSAHVEHLGSRDEIARERGDLLAALPETGTAVVNAGDAYADALARRTRARVLRFGLADGSGAPDVAASEVACEAGAFVFTLDAPQGRTRVRVQGLGAPTVQNALAAAAAALAAGASLAEVAEGLARYRPVAGRLERRELPGEIVLIDDSYNANPQSMEVALRLLAGSEAPGRRVAVLGDMGELGATAAEAHRATGRLVAELGIDLLVAVGGHAGEMAAAAAAAGMDVAGIRTAGSSDEAAALLDDLLGKGDLLLLKGSRSMKMERVAKRLETSRG
jgi:UDP-N-acetylmuramoyl-tripeptide--D-alanyl-D-alanine ligase